MLNQIQNSIRTKLLLPILLGCIAVAIVSALALQAIKQRNTELVGVTTAGAVASEIFSFRNFYSGTILPRAKANGSSADFNFDQTDDLLPLPATLVKTLGAEIAQHSPGSSIKYYSRYPFSFRVGTPDADIDAFQEDALDFLEANPDDAFYRLERRDGELVMRYIVADTMQESCVACHNSHPDSLKTDWEVGQVRGGLEVIVPVSEAEIGLNNGTIIVTSIVIGGFALIAGITWLLMQRNVIKPLFGTAAAMKEVEEGDLSARAPVYSNDEFGLMATSINNMLDVTGETIVSASLARDELQESIYSLLNEVSDVAEGDLRTEAQVGDNELGAVADSFNYMIGQLRTVIRDVQNATLQVSSSANEVQATAEQLSDGSSAQASQILDTSAAVDEMTISIQQVSENATLSASVGEEARDNAEKGAAAVRDTIDGMDRIRTQVQDTTKRMKRLGDSSQRIGEIIELIDDIADRTSILALNASIQAELAGEAGRSFAVVAEEVESLADRSTQATQQIAVLIRNIQSEINEAIVAMETTSEEATSGSALANEAGERLQEIETVSGRLAELINSISLAATQQARGSETIAQSMNDISNVTQQTAAGTKEATVSIGNLAELADGLRASVSTFKLPDVNEESFVSDN